MPNHVMNFVKFSDKLDEIREFVKGDVDADNDQRIFDFNKIVPMPEDVKTGNTDGVMPDWYRWSVENWGTKWNCYEVHEIENGFAFWTAWSAPEAVYIALSKQFPDIAITVDFADEDVGNGNCGRFILNDGECEFSQGDYEFACEIWGYEPVEEEEEDEL